MLSPCNSCVIQIAPELLAVVSHEDMILFKHQVLLQITFAILYVYIYVCNNNNITII